ncbi:TPA: type 1 fimbrial protein [Escherichia coli]|nr:type 1 fimbrial protein [Escherichia coli]
MKKLFLGASITMALAVSGANAAEIQGQGTVNFKGEVIDSPCSIAPESVDQTIQFGQISKAVLEKGGESVRKSVDIKLINCEFDAPKTVTATFSGATGDTTKNELTTAGNTGVAIVMSAADGTQVSFDGSSPAGKLALKPGENTLKYVTWVKKGTDTKGAVSEGAFEAVAQFNLTYN